MSARARDFVTEWTLKRGSAPISHADAASTAEEWEGEAMENGITRAELHAVVGGTVTDYLLRTYGPAD